MLAVRSSLPEIAAGPAVFAGEDACLTVALLIGLRGVRAQRPLLIVDGANAFDPFLIADLARKSGVAPRALLDQIRISRVFTCHQLEALLRGRLLEAVRRFHAGAVYFSGILDPLLDEEVPAGEAGRIFRLIPPVLRALAASRILTLCACPPPVSRPGRERLFPALCGAARWVFEVTRGADHPDHIRITCRRPAEATWTWEPQIGLIAPRRWW
ncbi:MAG: hypothetical protein QN141_06130 [Armatimonadota bacterium]|nr:hypothetical protein [Armatimonadota bacterium]MDR7451926.1 hypothetical protein [Armatimonadota bacterium]MDR7466608.1 hypothetical protein [Armatimonadota bacterium]MDR7492918.1 hypothetical protein [Armatimonadota bacterium]MDR7500315.1 hypothetical protein [Armatimonadota bacterium]